MTLKEIIFKIETDDFVIVHEGQIEEINGLKKGSFGALKKYFGYNVEKIVPLNNSVEITLS